ncbi:MAG: N-6 DNA methylase [Caldilineaceae bacterium]|nr:N-6 DNA methylase [Caldilineaceae bacterium]
MNTPRIAAVADHTKMFLGMIEKFRYQHNLYEVFRDWTELAAAEVHQLPYHAGVYAKDAAFEAVEAQYMQVAKKYERADFGIFAELLGITRLALATKHQDFLGQCYMRLEINNMRAGQYFTPYEVSLLVTRMCLEKIEPVIEENGGWFTLQEPACGSGGMVIAAAQILEERRIGSGTMYFDATDIDRLCSNMTYIQAGLLGLTGVVWHGNTLSMEMQSHRFTPAARLHSSRTNEMMASTKTDGRPPHKRKVDLSQPLLQSPLLEMQV